MPKILLSENTRIIVSLSTLMIVIGFAITATFTFTTWKVEIETTMESMKERTSLLEENDKNDKAVILEVQKDMVEIKTDLKWIRAYMEKIE